MRRKEEFRRKKSRSKKCCVHIQPLPCAATLSCFAFHATNVKYTVASRLCIARYAFHILVVLHSDDLSVGSERDFHIGTPSSYLCAVCFRNISLLTRPLICPVYFLAWYICGTNACRHQKISVAGSNIIAKVGCFHQDKCQVNFDPATDCSVFGSSCESSQFSAKIKKFYHC